MNKHTERARSPIRYLSCFMIVAAALAATPALAQEPAPICHSQSVNLEGANKTRVGATDASGASLCLYRGPTSVHLEVRQASIAAILSAMATTYAISFRSSVPLSELRSGRYVGPMRSVISEVLSGYDYAISHQPSALASRYRRLRQKRRATGGSAGHRRADSRRCKSSKTAAQCGHGLSRALGPADGDNDH